MLLSVDELHVHYGRLAAVRGVSIEVEEGEIVCIVGPNGAGKSTTLLTISGVLSPTSGAITFDGEPLTGIAPENIARRGISLVPEGRHIFSRLTVEENLGIGTRIRNDQIQIKEDIQRLLDQFPFFRSRFRDPAGKLSGGEQQQLAIGRALLTKPRIMMVDEPSLGLAPRIVDQVYEILTQLREKEGLAILIVEQSAQRAVQLADRIYVLRNGEITLEGTAETLADGKKFEEAYFGFGTSASGGKGGAVV